MGKTALATNIAFNAAKAYKPPRAPDGRAGGRRGGRVLFAGNVGRAARRSDSSPRSRASPRTASGGARSVGQNFDRFVQASQRLATVRLFIDDTPALSISGLRTRARRLLRQHGLGLVIVDYLQLLRPSAPVRLENRVQEIAEITRGLKTLAKELNVPVLALSQLSRAVEQREDKRPMLADLRESGSIEQDADVVMFVFREEYYSCASRPAASDETDEKYNDRYRVAEATEKQARTARDHHRQAAPRPDRHGDAAASSTRRRSSTITSSADHLPAIA